MSESSVLCSYSVLGVFQLNCWNEFVRILVWSNKCKKNARESRPFVDFLLVTLHFGEDADTVAWFGFATELDLYLLKMSCCFLSVYHLSTP